jgi:hypothetical protein
MEQCTFCGANLPADASFCGSCGRALLQESSQTYTISATHTPTAHPEGYPDGNIPTIGAYTGNQTYPGSAAIVTTGSAPTQGYSQAGGPMTPPPSAEDEDERHRWAVRPAPLVLPGPPAGNQMPSLQGTPHMPQMPTLAGTPQLPANAARVPFASSAGSRAPFGQTGPQLPARPDYPPGPRPGQKPSGCAVAGAVTVIFLVGLLVISAVLAFTAFSPNMTLSGSSAIAPGGMLHIHGQHFLPNSSIALTLDAGTPVQFTSGAPALQAHTRTSLRVRQEDLISLTLIPVASSQLHADGSGVFDITILADLQWAPGLHTLHASERPAGRSATMNFTINPSATPTPTDTPTPIPTDTPTPTPTDTPTPTPTPTNTPTPTPTDTPTPTPTATPTLQNFVGIWYNVDTQTRDWVRVEISADGNILVAHFFGACSPTPCDAGTTTSVYNGNPVHLHLVESFATRDFTLLLQGNILHITTFTHFTDNSGRSDYTIYDDFHQ